VLNPPHDTRHDTRLPVLTEVDGSMAPLEELDDSTKGLEGWRMAGLLWKIMSLLQTLRVYIYTLVLIRLLVDHKYNINAPATMSVLHPSSIRPFHIFRPRHHVFPNTSFSKRKRPFCRMMARYRPQVPLPNPLWKISCRMVFLYQTRPTSQSLSCTNFWC
jgi:hypothetical protein